MGMRPPGIGTPPSRPLGRVSEQHALRIPAAIRFALAMLSTSAIGQEKPAAWASAPGLFRTEGVVATAKLRAAVPFRRTTRGLERNAKLQEQPRCPRGRGQGPLHWLLPSACVKVAIPVWCGITPKWRGLAVPGRRRFRRRCRSREARVVKPCLRRHLSGLV